VAFIGKLPCQITANAACTNDCNFHNFLIAFVEFPGGHNGNVLHPRAFAERLRYVLGDASVSNS